MTDAADLDRYLASAQALADAARAVALASFRSPLAIERKPDASPVTEADRRIEALCRQKLAEWHPGHGVVGEEYPPTLAQAEHVWVIDPIDGTRGFIGGFPLWTTLIALLRHGEPVLGLIDAGATGERWAARRGGPAQYFAASDAPPRVCRTSGCTELAHARLALPAPHDQPAGWAAATAPLARRAGTCCHGGDGYAYALLASGHLDCIAEAGLDPHDFLAPAVVIQAAGGVITDAAGRPLGTASSGEVVAAATPALHAQMLALLRPA